ncbi:EAL domain-containing protein [Marinomonas sp. TW1]|uniref:EAL domain-containing protein n=1 Tax=Marinomonas sp. TW1 TaxID=1561203 RepID=UPI0018D2A1A4|nr:EAL domain-containing protein [Marinomonas sp. TW1]
MTIYLLLSISASLYIHHLFYLYQEKHSLQNYLEGVIDRTEQSVFQMHASLNLAITNHQVACSNEDLNSMRKTLLKYPYIEDIGRITADHKLVCSALWGEFLPPIKLPDEGNKDNLFRISWPITNGLFVKGLRRAVFSSGDAFVIPSPATFTNLTRYARKTGVVLYSSKEQHIYRTFDDITLEEADRAISYPQDNVPWLPTDNNFLTLSICPEGFSFCATAIDKKTGYYDMSLGQWLWSILVGVFFGLLTAISWAIFKSNRRSLIYRLKYALKNDQIYSLYQPKVQLKTGKIIGIEALARWQDQELGTVSPDKFIACAEQNKLITPLTQQLVKKNLDDMRRYLQADSEFTLSINLSIQDLSNQSFLHFIEKQIKQRGIHPQQIIFEVTERSAAQNNVLKQATKRFLRKGYQISLDDFGTGFSNLSWLTAFEPNEIKIDRMFIQSIGTQTVNQITLDSIFQLVSNLDVKLVFEGIESLEEVDYLTQHTPNAIGQGWLYSKAVDAKTIGKLLKNQPFTSATFLANDVD